MDRPYGQSTSAVLSLKGLRWSKLVAGGAGRMTRSCESSPDGYDNALEQATKPLCAGRGVEHWHLTAHAFGARTHRQYSAEEKMLSLERLRGEESIFRALPARGHCRLDVVWRAKGVRGVRQLLAR